MKAPPAARGDPAPWPGLDDILGDCLAMRTVFEQVRWLAQVTDHVLVLGETGTGKELVARALHRHSSRSSGPFVSVNCPAVPSALFESEFFGHERGAYTGADRVCIGKFEQAHGGTLLLDEVAELLLEAQAKLLRALDEREVTRLGGRKPIGVEVRIVAATNADLDVAVREGSFRRDLYWRLNGQSIRLPPLRDRGADILLLARHCLQLGTGPPGRPSAEISPEACEILMAYSWPGNIRELRSTLRSAAFDASGDVIRPENLPQSIRRRTLAAHSPSTTGGRLLRDAANDARSVAERREIVAALEQHHGRRSDTASALGIDRRTLLRKMKRYGILASSMDRGDGT